MVFIQTADMLELYKRNGECGIIVHVNPIKGKNGNGNGSKYQMNEIFINGVD